MALVVLAACSGTKSAPADSLIVGSREVTAMPGVIPCAAPGGLGYDESWQPLRSGYTPAAFHETPAEALQAFVADPPDGITFDDSGYVEMRFRDSTLYTDGEYLIFGRNFGYGWVTLVGVYHTADGWTVDWWAGSGC
jgi:hypothetical protein